MQRLKVLHNVVELAPQRLDDVGLQKLVKDAKHQLEKAVQEDAEFTAAARCAVKTDFRFVIG